MCWRKSVAPPRDHPRMEESQACSAKCLLAASGWRWQRNRIPVTLCLSLPTHRGAGIANRSAFFGNTSIQSNSTNVSIKERAPGFCFRLRQRGHFLNVNPTAPKRNITLEVHNSYMLANFNSFGGQQGRSNEVNLFSRVI